MPEKIVLQLPEGMKPLSIKIADCIRQKCPGAKIYIHGDPSYGACDLSYPELEYYLAPDLIIHVGHTPYPPELASKRSTPQGKTRVIYIPAESRLDVNENLLEDLVRFIEKYDSSNIGVVGTIQHYRLIPKIVRLLNKHGYSASTSPARTPYFVEGQVLGCEYGSALMLKSDLYVYVGGGLFHPLGLYLATMKPVIKLDPYHQKVEDLTPYGEKTYKKRMYKIMQAMNAKHWGLVLGLKTGQYRPWLEKQLSSLLTSKGVKYDVFLFEKLTIESLRSLPQEIDAYVVTSCPRLPIDDLADFEKPVLTPGEAVMALTGKLERYRFPW
ncbi:MAG: diphthamide biosynthesis enzyme Dph2 [Desulfurococcales archaeon]|nr:diphthamide biosynthesis enzyme Dph2 [Desulfurococcales archaeon]